MSFWVVFINSDGETRNESMGFIKSGGSVGRQVLGQFFKILLFPPNRPALAHN